MNALIGDRFLKRFIGRRLPRHTDNPIGESLTLPEYTAEKPTEQDCPPSEDLPNEKETLEIKKTGDINQIQNTHE
jgi:hypothetical protein